MSEEPRTTLSQMRNQFLTTFRDSAIQGLMSQKKGTASPLTGFLTQVRHFVIIGALATAGALAVLLSAAAGIADALARPHWEFFLYLGLLLGAASWITYRMTVGKPDPRKKLRAQLKRNSRYRQDSLPTDGIGVDFNPPPRNLS